MDLGPVDRPLTVERPVTYWSFWRTLLLASPVLLLGVAVAALLGGGRLTLVTLVPVPFVFLAATLGYAVRALNGDGILTSVGGAAFYVAVLTLTDAAPLLLARPRPLLVVYGLLIFAAAVAGFISPTLHGGRDVELAAARREFENRREEREH